MNNETQRKITSLTLMTIMLAGGMTFAIPGVLPTASAETGKTENLFVSSVNFGGPMVLEVIVSDSNIGETDEAKGQPNVTFDGEDLIMAQGDDGNWYAYVADRNMAEVTEGITAINFGTPDCDDVDDGTPNGVEPKSDAIIYCGASVIKKPQSLNTNDNANDDLASIGKIGQIGLIELDPNDLQWPFIQTFVFTDSARIDVIYDGSTDQVVEVTYTEDMDDLASYSLDRTTYPHSADIHMIIDDMQLNIDPTDEDIWTFDVSGSQDSFYSDVVTDDPITSANQDDLFYDDNGFLDIDSNEIILVRDQTITITFEETLPNSGIFDNTNDSDVADLVITSVASIRGDTGVIEYNDQKTSVLVDYFGGSVLIDVASIDGDWSSGEPIDIIIVDEDVNTNTLLDNDFDVSDANYLTIPAITIGSPITLSDNTDIANTIDTVTTEGVAELFAAPAVPETKSSGTITHAGGEIADGVTITINGTEVYTAATDDTAAFTFLNTGNGAADFAALLAELSLSTLVIVTSSDATTIDIEAIADGELGDLITLSSTDGGITFSNPTLTGGIDAVAEVFPADEILEVITSTQNSLTTTVDSFSDRAIVTVTDLGGVADPILLGEFFANGTLTVTYSETIADLDTFIDEEDNIYSFFNYDISSLDLDNPVISIINDNGTATITTDGDDSGFVLLDRSLVNNLTQESALTIQITSGNNTAIPGDYALVMDFVRYAGEDGRINDAIYRFEAEETTSNSGQYIGTVEYIMLNQINIYNADTFTGLETIGDELDVIVHEDLTDEDGLEMIYLDTDAQGVQTQVSEKEDAPTYSGIITFDDSSYKVADTVTVTLDDADLNTDSDIIDIYTVTSNDVIALQNDDGSERDGSRLFDVTINDALWQSCTVVDSDDVVIAEGLGLSSYMSTLVETEKDSGLFTTTFQIPTEYCVDIDEDGNGTLESVTGNDLEVNYQDFRDASGETIETGDSAGIRANTGSVAFDRTVYPVPWGVPDDGASFFSLHASTDSKIEGQTYLNSGDLIVHIRVNDPDFDTSASGEDKIAVSADNGPVKITVSRGSSSVVLATAGASIATDGLITLGENPNENDSTTLELGPIVEIAPDAGIFELDLTVRFTDGPASSSCPEPNVDSTLIAERIAFDDAVDKHCILQGDILTVQYNDPTDASGSANTVTDSATFDLRNGVIQSDKSVYIIGSDMILTLIEPDFDLDNDSAESYDLDLIEWDSDAATITMGNLGGNAAFFDPEPSSFRETGDSTGIFQIVIEIPESLDDDSLERGEEIVLEYTDWGPSGADYVGDEDEDVNLTIFTSNFGATIELDQKVYTWTDKVYITIVAPDHNFDGDLIDEIGNTSSDPIKVSTRGHDIDTYKLVETGTDTGIFTGEVILTGFTHDADGDTTTGIGGNDIETGDPTGTGPTDGLLPADDDDGLTVSFEFSDGETVLGSALIRWNIGEVQWLEASYPASGTGVVRVIDPDMNLNPESVDNFNVDVWSDSDAGGIDLTITETNEATGIFEGTVFFTVTDQSSGHRLRVAEGDTVTAEYEDNTLPDPYTTADELDITATSLIGTVVPPLERAPAANLRTVDAFGNSLSTVSVDQQVQISADLSNGQERDQSFAYLVQIQNQDGVTVSLAWITGSLASGQSFSPALSWIPTTSGSFTATAFVWESVDNPTALSPPVSTTIDVS